MSATGQEGGAGSQAPRPSTPERLPRRQQFLEWKRQRELLQQTQQPGGRRRHSSTPADLERQRLLLQRRVNMTPLTLKAAGVGPQESPSPSAKCRNSSSSTSGLKTPSPTTSKARQEKQRAFLPLVSDDHEHHDDTTTGSEPTHSGTNSQSSATSEEEMDRDDEEGEEEEERRTLEFLLQEELGEEDDGDADEHEEDDVESQGGSNIEEDVAILDEPMPLMEFDPERATPVDVNAEEEAFVDKEEESLDVEQEEDPAFWAVGEEAERLLMNYSMQSETTEEDAPINFSLSANSDAFDETDQHFSDDRSHELHLAECESSDIGLNPSGSDHYGQEYYSDHEQDEHDELEYEFSEIDLDACGIDEKAEASLNDQEQDEREALTAELEAALSDTDGPDVTTSDVDEVEIQAEAKTSSAGRKMYGTLILAIVYTTVLVGCVAVCQYYPESSLGQWLLSTKEHTILLCEDAYASIQKVAVLLWNIIQEQFGIAKNALAELLNGSYAVWHHAIHTYVPKVDSDRIRESISIVMSATIDRAYVLLNPLLEDPVGCTRGAMAKAYDIVDSGVTSVGNSLSGLWLNLVSSPNIPTQDLIDASRKRLLEPLVLNKDSLNAEANDMVKNEELWALNEKKRKAARRTEFVLSRDSVVAHTEDTIMKEIEAAKLSAADQIKTQSQNVLDKLEQDTQLDLDKFDEARLETERENIMLLTDHVAYLEKKRLLEMEEAAAKAVAAKPDIERDQQRDELRLTAKAESEAELARAQLVAEKMIPESDLVEVEIAVDVEVKNGRFHAFVEVDEHEAPLLEASRLDDGKYYVLDALSPIEEISRLPASGMDVQSMLIVSVISLVFLVFGGIAAYFLRPRIQRMMRQRHSHIRRKRWQRPVELSDSEEEVVVLLPDDNGDEEPEPEKVSRSPDRSRFSPNEIPVSISSEEATTTSEAPAVNAISVATEQEDTETRTSESSVSSAGHVRFSETVETVSPQDNGPPSPSSVRRSRRFQRRQSPTRNR